VREKLNITVSAAAPPDADAIEDVLDEVYEDEDDVEEEAEYDPKWYYLGGESLMEAILTVFVLAVMGFFAYTWLESEGYWAKYVQPFNAFVWRFLKPLYDPLAAVFLPVYTALFGETVEMAADRSEL
jgi:hypothetical protein